MFVERLRAHNNNEEVDETETINGSNYESDSDSNSDSDIDAEQENPTNCSANDAADDEVDFEGEFWTLETLLQNKAELEAFLDEEHWWSVRGTASKSHTAAISLKVRETSAQRNWLQ